MPVCSGCYVGAHLQYALSDNFRAITALNFLCKFTEYYDNIVVTIDKKGFFRE
jgi:hypothetical protein